MTTQAPAAGRVAQAIGRGAADDDGVAEELRRHVDRGLARSGVEVVPDRMGRDEALGEGDDLGPLRAGSGD
jgi:hypothetical protein